MARHRRYAHDLKVFFEVVDKEPAEAPRTSWTGWDHLSASNGSPHIRQRRLRSRGVAVPRADQEAMAFREDPVFEVERCCGFEERPCGDVLHPEQMCWRRRLMRSRLLETPNPG